MTQWIYLQTTDSHVSNYYRKVGKSAHTFSTGAPEVAATSAEESEVDCTSTSVRSLAMTGNEGAPGRAVDMSGRLKDTSKPMHHDD